MNMSKNRGPEELLPNGAIVRTELRLEKIVDCFSDVPVT
jgi:hypothetical protein